MDKASCNGKRLAALVAGVHLAYILSKYLAFWLRYGPPSHEYRFVLDSV
jgi:hypothetical protein